MAREDWSARPPWWPRWVPVRCANGHPLLPGRVSISWAICHCPGSGGAHGHDVWVCAVNGCRWEVWPPEHCGPQEDQRGG